MGQATVGWGRLAALLLLTACGLGCPGRNDALLASGDDAAIDSALTLDAPRDVPPERPTYSSYCTNGNKDPNETDFDCGGNCAPCAIGKGCIQNTDCAKGTCVSFLCTAAATCSNNKRDGKETDVDCGGSDCATCAAGKKCTVGTDCSSGTCTSGTCS
jgi:hypothetical protein